MDDWRADRPNNALPALPPKDFKLTETQQAQLVVVAELLARLDEAAELLANPAVFNNAMPMVEAVASSEIENIITTHDEMFVANASETRKVTPETRLAMRNRAALNLGFEHLRARPITVKLLSDIASELLGYRVGVRDLPGTFIGNEGAKTYTPPEGKERIEKMLHELASFIAESEWHPVLVMILAHYQFEAIHPFPDGNGRTGRVLNQLILLQAGVLRTPVLNLSSYLVRNRDDYYAKLHGVEHSGDWGAWVSFMLQAVETAVKNSYKKLKELTLLQLQVQGVATVNVGKFAIPLTALIFEKPYCQIGHVVDRLEVSRPTAAKLLETMEAAGSLVSFVSGKEKFFVNQAMLEVLAK